MTAKTPPKSNANSFTFRQKGDSIIVRNSKRGFFMRYATKGTCSRFIDFDLEDGIVKNVVFTGGCNGNLKGIGALVEGMDAKEAIKRLSGITCGFKPTSCPDQLAKALEEALAEN